MYICSVVAYLPTHIGTTAAVSVFGLVAKSQCHHDDLFEGVIVPIYA